MTIIIYRLKNINGEIKAVEWDRWKNGNFLGRLKNLSNMSKDQVINQWNRGYYRTSELD